MLYVETIELKTLVKCVYIAPKSSPKITLFFWLDYKTNEARDAWMKSICRENKENNLSNPII